MIVVLYGKDASRALEHLVLNNNLKLINLDEISKYSVDCNNKLYGFCLSERQIVSLAKNPQSIIFRRPLIKILKVLFADSLNSICRESSANTTASESSEKTGNDNFSITYQNENLVQNLNKDLMQFPVPSDENETLQLNQIDKNFGFSKQDYDHFDYYMALFENNFVYKQVIVESLNDLNVFLNKKFYLDNRNILKSSNEFDEYMINVANAVAFGSVCVRRRVGALITFNNVIISIGYCGKIQQADGTLANCIDGHCNRCKNSNIKTAENLNDCVCIHAEDMAIRGIPDDLDPKLCTLYSNLQPCHLCEALINNKNFKRLVFENEYRKSQINTL